MTSMLRQRDCLLLLLLPSIIALSVQFDEKRARSPLKTFAINGPHHFYSPFARRPISATNLDDIGDIRPTQTTNQGADPLDAVEGTETNEFRPLWQWIHNHHLGGNNHGGNNHGGNNHGGNNHGGNNHGGNNHGVNNHGVNNHGGHNPGHNPGYGGLANQLLSRFTATETVVSTVVIYVPDQVQQDTYTMYVPTTSYIVQEGHHHTHTVTTTRTSVINAGVTITEAEQLAGGEAVLTVDTVTQTRTVTSTTTSTRTINAGVTITDFEQLAGGEAVLQVDTVTVTVPTTKTVVLPTTTVIVSQSPPITQTSTSTVYVPTTTTMRETVTKPNTIPIPETLTSTVYVPKTSTVFVPKTRTVVSVDPGWISTTTVTLATATRTVSEIILKTTYLPTTVTVTDHEGEDSGGEGDGGHGGGGGGHHNPRPTRTVTKTKTKTVAFSTLTSYLPDETRTVTETDFDGSTVYIPITTTVGGAPSTLTVSVARTTVVITATKTIRLPSTTTKYCERPPGGGPRPPSGGQGQGGHGGNYYPSGGDGEGHFGLVGEDCKNCDDHGYPWPHHHTVTQTVSEDCDPPSTHYETTTLPQWTTTKTITESAHLHPDHEDHGHNGHHATATITKTITNTLTVPSMTTETLYVPTTTTEIVEGFETITLPASTVTVYNPTTTTKTVWETEDHHHSSLQPTVTVTVWPSEEHHHHSSEHPTVTVTSPMTVTYTIPTTVTKTKSTTVTRIKLSSVTETVYPGGLSTTTVTYYPDYHPHPRPQPPCNLDAIGETVTSMDHLISKIKKLVARLIDNAENPPPCDSNQHHSPPQPPTVGNLEIILTSLGQLMESLKNVIEQKCSPVDLPVRPPPRPRPPHRPCGHKPLHGSQGDCRGSAINVQALESLSTGLESLIVSVGSVVNLYEQHGHQGYSKDDLRKQLEYITSLQAVLTSQDVTDKFSDDLSENQVSSFVAQPLEKIQSLKILMRHSESLAEKPLVLVPKLEQIVEDLKNILILVNATERTDAGDDIKKLLQDDAGNMTHLTAQKVDKIYKEALSNIETTPTIFLRQNGTQLQEGSKQPANLLSEKDYGNRNSTTPKRKPQGLTRPNVATSDSGNVVQNPVSMQSASEEMVFVGGVRKSVVPQEMRSSGLGALKEPASTSPATTEKMRKSKISLDKWS